MLSQKEARKILEPFEDDLYLCISLAWEKWQAELKPSFRSPTPRGRANVIYDLAADEARERFGNRPGVQIIERPGNIFLLFAGEVTVRFKKLGKNLGSSNYQTQQALDLEGQLALPGVPEGSIVKVGYRLGQFQDEILDILAVFSCNDRVLWHYELDAPPVENLVSIPAREEEDAVPARLVRPKFEREDEEEGGSSQ